MRVRLARALAVLCFLAAVGAHSAPAAAPFTPWCGGGEELPSDRLDAVSAFQIHVVYAIPSDGVDRFADTVSKIDTDMAAMDVWWRKQDPSRTPRFDVFAFPDCQTTFGGLDVSAVRLPRPTSAYAPLSQRYERIRDDLDAAGFKDADKKYLVYYDAPVEAGSTVCGQADTGMIGGGAKAYAIVYLAGFCGNGLGVGGVATVIATHELIHGLNALAFPPSTPGPPHACPNDPGHPCDNPNDILAASQSSTVVLDQLALDVGRDDYYGHSGSWWDVQDSPFLARLDSPDQAPPSAPPAPTVTGKPGVVTVSWQAATDDVGPVSYRVYRDGQLIGTTSSLSFDDLAASAGRTYRYALRAADSAGFLSPQEELRFKVGLGIVDDGGKLIKDTVPPPAVESLRSRKTRTGIRLTWRGFRDPGGLQGYRVDRNGVFYANTVRPVLVVPANKAKARWVVREVDRAGNLGPPVRLVVR